jgi:hypothetical protein
MQKTFFTIVSAMFFLQSLSAQIVNIPNFDFKQFLTSNSKINTNGDIEIQLSEAIAFNGSIDVSGKEFKNLTGIEAFINLKNLNCNGNKLTALDVSKNIALTRLDCNNNKLVALEVDKNLKLTHLDCDGNELTTLNISKNIALTSLVCADNQLITLDISKNTAMNYLNCSTNQLSSLDLSKNIALIGFSCYENKIIALDLIKNTNLSRLNCYENKLTSLNLKNGTNSSIIIFDVTKNPFLKCIQVDNTNNIGSNWYKDTTAFYSTQCTVSADDIYKGSDIVPYPNPVSDHLYFNGIEKIKAVTVFNAFGKLLFEETNLSQGIDLQSLANEIYFLKIKLINGQSISKKIVKVE